MGWSYIGFIILVLTVNAGVIIYNTTEDWRHTRAVKLNNRLVLEYVTNMETMANDEAEKKAVRLKIRDEFIKKRMMESEVAMPSKIQSESSAKSSKKNKPTKSKKDGMGVIDTGIELSSIDQKSEGFEI